MRWGWRPKRRKGLTLQPGESAEIALPDELRAELIALDSAGHHVVFEQGPVKQEGRKFSRGITVMVDGEPRYGMSISWESDPSKSE
jgi:hypothetical protein